MRSAFAMPPLARPMPLSSAFAASAAAAAGADLVLGNELLVLLSVATKNRFWPHALSMLSLVEALVTSRSWLPPAVASETVPRLRFEWHVIDDASNENVRRKDALVNDLVRRGIVHNYTRLRKPSGTVKVLGHFVDVVLARPDIHYWLHCDDDVLMGPDVLSRAVYDYHRALARGAWRPSSSSSPSTTGGGLLAIFVNSWLDNQLSSAPPAFGPFKVVPFLGGASYVVDRVSLVSTGNPWASARRAMKGVSPHEAHEHWLRELLPSHGLPIWIRWDEPYRCQHLGNVATLNFGRQPDWEPMWAIDHRSKHIVEVPGYPSADVRAALWSGGEALRDYVLQANQRSPEALRLPASASSASSAERAWSPYNYPRQHAHYVEIGTADFDTLVQRHVWRPEIVGMSVEPIKAYLDRLPGHGGSNKTLLHAAVGEYDGFTDVYLVRPELVGGPYLGAQSLCRPEAAREARLPGGQCLPGWVRGTSSLGRWPEGVRQRLSEEQMRAAVAVTRVPLLKYSTLLTVYGIGSVDIVKIDAEGLDHVILKQVVDFAEQTGVWPWQVQFEKNILSDWRALDGQVKRLQDEFRYNCRMSGAENVACWRPGSLDLPSAL